ncbi:MAG: FtsW/RodA/SpoVE family cell cycle protein, partial [Phycisphaerae bacterium]
MFQAGQMELWREMNDDGTVDNPAGEALSVSILVIAAGLLAIGAVMSFSASASVDRPLIGSDFWRSQTARQFIFVIGGLVAMLVTSRVPYWVWSLKGGMPAAVLLIVSLAACTLVLVPHVGVEVKGAARWIQVGPASWGIRFQP